MNALEGASPAFLHRKQGFLREIKMYSLQDELRITQALDLMILLHGDQARRFDGSEYVQHPLEVALKLIGESADEVIAALLHDSVEDQAAKLARPGAPNIRESALEVLQSYFGIRVRNLVAALSNPDYDALLQAHGITYADRDEYQALTHSMYQAHVQELIKDDGAARIKLADFMGNALFLDAIGNEKRRASLARKYVPVARMFIARIPSLPLADLSGDVLDICKQDMLEQLNTFISEYS